ncbi:MAG: hypothetical protein IPK80_35285 [Nannocystis sp.]|nr:hypothetical protein [Nannocystis sp.]
MPLPSETLLLTSMLSIASPMIPTPDGKFDAKSPESAKFGVLLFREMLSCTHDQLPLPA